MIEQNNLFRYKISFPIIIISVLFASCNRIPRGYKPYQTFDEYLMKGVNDTHYVEPYVAVKTLKDTILVIVIDDNISNNTPIKYIKFESYWYSKLKYHPKYPENCGCDTTPKIRERFFFNDTIMEYSYFLKRNKRSLEQLCFQTKKGMLILNDSDGFKAGSGTSFQKLKSYGMNYSNKFEKYMSTPKYQKRYYHLYLKQIHKDTLFLYENIGNKLYKHGDVVGKDKLNSMGEFGIEIGRVGW